MVGSKTPFDPKGRGRGFRRLGDPKVTARIIIWLRPAEHVMSDLDRFGTRIFAGIPANPTRRRIRGVNIALVPVYRLVGRDARNAGRKHYQNETDSNGHGSICAVVQCGTGYTPYRYHRQDAGVTQGRAKCRCRTSPRAGFASGLLPKRVYHAQFGFTAEMP